MLRYISWGYGLILAIAAAILAVAIHSAIGAPSLESVKRAMNLYPGRSLDVSVNGQIIHITFRDIQSLSGGRYAIIVDAH